MREKLLPQLSMGQGGKVLDVSANSDISERLIELGFLPGNHVKKLYGDRTESICAYRIAQSCIALRREDAACVRVQCDV